jgi:hypothetical protein
LLPLRGFGAFLLVLWTFLALPALGIDRVSLIAWAIFLATLAVAAARPALVDRARSALLDVSPRTFVVSAAVIAVLLSYLFVSGPMRDRPVSIDATVYLLQARALAHGHLGMPIPEPRQMFGGRFLFEGTDGHLYGVFPPGFPLFLSPFVALGVPLLVGPVLAGTLVLAQALLGRAIEGQLGFATRFSILLSLPSFARVVETADLLSHAFVAVLATVAIALAIEARTKPTPQRLLLIGAAVGWALIARLLDGVVIAIFVAVVLRGRVLLPILTMLPFLTFFALAQKAATGSFAIPTQSLYFARSDFPPTCHRLGFGVDVGCMVEHGDERNSFGADGYTTIDALRVVRERASGLCGDLFGFAPLAFVAFTRVVRDKRDVFLGGAVVTFTLAYGLFYYGNAPIFGARHLFPIAALFWLLAARAVEEPLHPRLVGLPIAMVLAGGFAFVPRWLVGSHQVLNGARARVDVRAVIDRSELQRGLVVTDDELSWIAAFDPYRDGSQRIVVRFDRSGLKDVRRAYPQLPVHNVIEGDVLQTTQLPPPPPGLLFELERAWPSFVRPNGVGTRVVNTRGCCKVDSSGERALFVLASREQGSFSIPFTTARADKLTLRVDGLVAPDYGTWAIDVDGHALPTFEGYAPEVAAKKGDAAMVDLPAGAHTITFRCTGKHAESRGYLGAFDALVGTP